MIYVTLIELIRDVLFWLFINISLRIRKLRSRHGNDGGDHWSVFNVEAINANKNKSDYAIVLHRIRQCFHVD